MRNVVLAFGSLVALSSIASADPLSVAATTHEDVAPTTYVQGGLNVGGNDGLVTAGASVEMGKRVAPIVWLHASFMMGSADELFASGTGSIMQARVGADLMTCSDNGALCAFAGADVGMQHAQFSGVSDPWFCDGDANDCMGDPVAQDRTRAIGVARVGLDIGGKHLRWRPGIEATVAGDGVNGLDLTQSIAYRF